MNVAFMEPFIGLTPHNGLMKVVISLGGSLLTRELTPENFTRYAEVLRRLRRRGHRLVVVCGGGRTARVYQRLVKELGGDEELQDLVGIEATHMNAMTLIAALGEDAHPRSLRTVEEVVKNFGDRIIVCGGDKPGCSTDYDAALFAEALRADLLVNATDVDGVYTADPKRDPNAVKLDRLTYDRLEEILSKNVQAPGEYGLFDLKAVEVLRRSGVRLVVVDGRDPEEIIRAVEGGHRGSEVYG